MEPRKKERHQGKTNRNVFFFFLGEPSSDVLAGPGVEGIISSWIGSSTRTRFKEGDTLGRAGNRIVSPGERGPANSGGRCINGKACIGVKTGGRAMNFGFCEMTKVVISVEAPQMQVNTKRRKRSRRSREGPKKRTAM